ncbi:MAG: helix-turn-helix transcriptional regulator [Oceanicaulis sp.]
MRVSRFTTPGGERLIIIPEAEYERLLAAADDAEDLDAVRRFRSALASGEEELLPDSVVERILNHESPIRVWREHRGLSLRALAAKASLSPAYLSEIETGKKSAGLGALKALAGALGVQVDDLIADTRDQGELT